MTISFAARDDPNEQLTITCLLVHNMASLTCLLVNDQLSCQGFHVMYQQTSALQWSQTRQQCNFYKEKTHSSLTTICDNGLQNDCAGLLDIGGLIQVLDDLTQVLDYLIQVVDIGIGLLDKCDIGGLDFLIQELDDLTYVLDYLIQVGRMSSSYS